jgi:hypothetical protein
VGSDVATQSSARQTFDTTIEHVTPRHPYQQSNCSLCRPYRGFIKESFSSQQLASLEAAIGESSPEAEEHPPLEAVTEQRDCRHWSSCNSDL